MAQNRLTEGKPPSQRQLRVGEVIRRTLSEILSRGEIHDPDLGRMFITVGEVRVTSDLRTATAFVLPLGGDNAKEAIDILARNQGEIRRAIGQKAKLKHAPEMRFRIDTTYDQMDKTREMFADERVQRDIRKTDDPKDPDA